VNELPRLLTADEVSAATGISKFRLYELVRRGEMPACHLGRSVRWIESELNEWLRSGGMKS
jgi:excisionase family DNA binding protein